ncbi:hypothetical protein SAMN05216276_105010 [Streptosporangium subroseum]|uniref:Uncharacterized protein n=1 Tax=Streptosporangium subroseum TaxID=106412 RepID=A0A239N3M2_9ACTN|nr:hypothetical protein SAMN05216276_105010 [Streptosporangium subroseum]
MSDGHLHIVENAQVIRLNRGCAARGSNSVTRVIKGQQVGLFLLGYRGGD